MEGQVQGVFIIQAHRRYGRLLGLRAGSLGQHIYAVISYHPALPVAGLATEYAHRASSIIRIFISKVLILVAVEDRKYLSVLRRKFHANRRVKNRGIIQIGREHIIERLDLIAGRSIQIRFIIFGRPFQRADFALIFGRFIAFIGAGWPYLLQIIGFAVFSHKF